MADIIKCIYYIKDLRNENIIYIGQTVDFRERKNAHFSHKKRPIDKHMFEEGRDNFSMEIFDIDCTNMTDEERKIKEDELILFYNTIDNGFNRYRSLNISKVEDRKEYLKEYHKNYRSTEKRKEYMKEYHAKYRSTEKRKEYMKEYHKKQKR